jgi:hypothetical protein
MPQPCQQAHERRLHRHELLVRRRWPPHLDEGIPGRQQTTAEALRVHLLAAWVISGKSPEVLSAEMRSHARPSRGASSSLSGIAKNIWTGGVTGRTTPPTITATSVPSYLNNGKVPRISWMTTGRSTT